MAERKFYKTTYTFEVLSEEPIINVSLEDLIVEYADTFSCPSCGLSLTTPIAGRRRAGDWVKEPTVVVLNGKEGCRCIDKQGNDTGFFMLTENGEDVEEKSQAENAEETPAEDPDEVELG